MAEKRITGAVGINGQVFYAGQEAELEAAAKGAGIDLSGERFAQSLEGFGPARRAAAEAEETAEPSTEASTAATKTAAKSRRKQ